MRKLLYTLVTSRRASTVALKIVLSLAVSPLVYAYFILREDAFTLPANLKADAKNLASETSYVAKAIYASLGQIALTAFFAVNTFIENHILHRLRGLLVAVVLPVLTVCMLPVMTKEMDIWQDVRSTMKTAFWAILLGKRAS